MVPLALAVGGAVGGLLGDHHRGRVEGAVGVGVVGQHRDGRGGALGDGGGVVDRDRGVVDRGDGEGHGGGVAECAGVVLDGVAEAVGGHFGAVGDVADGAVGVDRRAAVGGCWVITTVAGLRVPSASVSLASTAMVVVAPSATVAVSLPATGGWLVGAGGAEVQDAQRVVGAVGLVDGAVGGHRQRRRARGIRCRVGNQGGDRGVGGDVDGGHGVVGAGHQQHGAIGGQGDAGGRGRGGDAAGDGAGAVAVCRW